MRWTKRFVLNRTELDKKSQWIGIWNYECPIKMLLFKKMIPFIVYIKTIEDLTQQKTWCRGQRWPYSNTSIQITTFKSIIGTKLLSEKGAIELENWKGNEFTPSIWKINWNFFRISELFNCSKCLELKQKRKIHMNFLRENYQKQICLFIWALNTGA